MCLVNMVQTFHLAQTQAYNTGVHECLISLQQDDEDPNFRAAATYALGNLLEHVPLPSSNNSLSYSTSSSSRSRLQSTLPLPVSVIPSSKLGSPTPIISGPQAFNNSNLNHSAVPPYFRPGGMLSIQG